MKKFQNAFLKVPGAAALPVEMFVEGRRAEGGKTNGTAE
jgi:hypothetical protein